MTLEEEREERVLKQAVAVTLDGSITMRQARRRHRVAYTEWVVDEETEERIRVKRDNYVPLKPYLRAALRSDSCHMIPDSPKLKKLAARR